MNTLIALAIFAAVVGIGVWMVQMGRRDYCEMRASSDRAAPLKMMAKARGYGVLVSLPVIVILVLPVPSWLVTVYLVGLIVVLLPIVIARRGRGGS